MMNRIFMLTPEEMTKFLTEWFDFKIARMRSKQIFDWIYNKLVVDYDQMSNIPQNLREILKEQLPITLPLIEEKLVSADGTEKYLLKLRDEKFIEMVIIPDKAKNTLCISSQVGCARNCYFCATAKMGLIRNLSTEEIISQLLLAKITDRNRKITNLVFMGMGEPLDNLYNVCRAIRLIQNDGMLSFSPRRITVSTCGVIPGITKLSNEKLKIKLAVSLNSANQAKREKIMPIAKSYPLQDLKNALLSYQRNTPFRITFEYVMIKDFNMGEKDALNLIKFLGDISCKLNLIAWNKGNIVSEYSEPTQDDISRFMQYIEPLKAAVIHRKSRGADINAACGQLTAKRNQKQ